MKKIDKASDEKQSEKKKNKVSEAKVKRRKEASEKKEIEKALDEKKKEASEAEAMKGDSKKNEKEASVKKEKEEIERMEDRELASNRLADVGQVTNAHGVHKLKVPTININTFVTTTGVHNLHKTLKFPSIISPFTKSKFDNSYDRFGFTTDKKTPQQYLVNNTRLGQHDKNWLLCEALTHADDVADVKYFLTDLNGKLMRNTINSVTVANTKACLSLLPFLQPGIKCCNEEISTGVHDLHEMFKNDRLKVPAIIDSVIIPEVDPINTLNKNFEPLTHVDGIADVKYFLTDMWRNLYSTSSLTQLPAIQVKGLEDNFKVKTSIKRVCYDRG